MFKVLIILVFLLSLITLSTSLWTTEIIKIFYRHIPALESSIVIGLSDLLIDYKKQTIEYIKVKPLKKNDGPPPPVSTTALSLLPNQMHGIRKSLSEILSRATAEPAEPEKSENVNFDTKDPNEYLGGADKFYKDYQIAISNSVYSLLNFFPLIKTHNNIDQIKEEYQYEDFDSLAKSSPKELKILEEINYTKKIAIIKCLLEYMTYNKKQTFSNLKLYLNNLKKEFDIPISSYKEFLQRNKQNSLNYNNA